MLLPASVRSLLHDCDAASVSWERHPQFLIDRILAEGTWDAVCWLRRTAGDAALLSRIVDTRGSKLSARQLRLWQVLLDIPEDSVSAWLAQPARAVWDRRTA